MYVNDEVDKFGNVASFQSNFKGATKEDKFYFGNMKESIPMEAQVESGDVPDADGLPF
jgi:hypothetical protein